MTGKKRQGKGESKMSPRRLKAREKCMRAIDMRIAGLTWEQIAEELGCSTSGAYKLVMNHIRREGKEKAEEFIEFTFRRLERMVLYLWGEVQRGNLKAIDRILAIIEQEAKILGIDKAKLDISPKIEVIFENNDDNVQTE